MKDFFITGFVVLIALAFLYGMSYDMYSSGMKKGKQELIQALCSKQSYDFCTIEKIEYGLKNEVK